MAESIDPRRKNTGEHHPNVSEATVARLLSLYDGEMGVLDLILRGPRAIPALRALLFRRDRTGIYQPRRWAIEVLAALGAHDALRDYLLAPHEATDPVERTGDEAVVNAAARALSKVRQEWAFRLLLDLAGQRVSAGVIEALGSFDRPETIPALIEALAEDDCRGIAEVCLQRLGTAALPALLQAALERQPSAHNESETSLRRRRSALCVLAERQLAPKDWQEVRELLGDSDSRIAVLACKLCLGSAAADEKTAAILRLQELIRDADWILAMEIRHVLQDFRSVETLGTGQVG